MTPSDRVRSDLGSRAQIHDTVDAGWAGPIAEQATTNAARFGTTLARLAGGVEWLAPGTVEGDDGLRIRDARR